MRYVYLFENHEELLDKWSFLRKEPKYLEFFKKLIKNDGPSINKNDDEPVEISKKALELCEDFYETIQRHRNTIKQNNIDVLSINSFEELTDMIADVELIEKFNKFTKLLPNHLRNELRGSKSKSDKFKNTIINFEYEEYKNIFLKKVSKYKSVGELFKAINNYLASTNKSIHEIIDEIEDMDGIDVFSVSDEVLIAIVFSKEASCKFGSQQWCISGNGGSYWNTYVPKKLGVQYFVWDFNKEESDTWSKIGISVYTDRYEAFDNADRRISNISKAIGKKRADSLLNIDQLSDDQAKKYLLYNISDLLIYNDGDGKNTDRFSKIIDNKFKRELFFKNPKGSLNFFDTVDFVSDSELQKVVNKHPKIISYKTVNKRLSTEYMREFAIKHPDKIDDIDESHFETLSKTEYRNMVFNYTTYLDKTNTSSHVVNIWDRLEKIKRVKLEYMEDIDFIKSLFKTNLNHSLRFFADLLMKIPMSEVNEMYMSNENAWDRILDEGINNKNVTGYRVKKHFDILKSYFNNKTTMENFASMDLFVFNARYTKREIGVNPNSGKKQYEEVLEPEKMVRVNPLTLNHIVGAMRRRTMVQDDLTLYGMWVSLDLFDEETIDSMLKDDWFLDLIDSRKFTV